MRYTVKPKYIDVVKIPEFDEPIEGHYPIGYYPTEMSEVVRQLTEIVGHPHYGSDDNFTWYPRGRKIIMSSYGATLIAKSGDCVVVEDDGLMRISSKEALHKKYMPMQVNTLGESNTIDLDAGVAVVNYLMDMQRDVEKSWGRLPDPDNPEQVSTYLREVVLCATDELHEVLAEVNWKPWKSSRGIKDVAKYREELADVLHFILDMYLAAGLTGRELIEDYLDKHDVNMVRAGSDEYKES